MLTNALEDGFLDTYHSMKVGKFSEYLEGDVFGLKIPSIVFNVNAVQQTRLLYCILYCR